MRTRKLGIESFQGTLDKAGVLKKYLADHGISADETVYIGNDINDLQCFPLVACAFTPSDAHPIVKGFADIVLQHPGGKGAVRELSEIIVEKNEESNG
jgi:N-acylneuraminate cytidylyltransferase